MSKSDTRRLVAVLKDTGTDHEWYPTTKHIIDCIKKDMDETFYRESPSVLDCGAGDGRVLKALTEGSKYAIEKSRPLLDALDSDIFVVGTHFEEQTLIDKKCSVCFSNPPYSEFVQWSTKIIREANAGVIYLVIPERWKDSLEIQDALRVRDSEGQVIGSFDFEDADRQARAKVDIVKIRLSYRGGHSSNDRPKTDPFSVWFDQFFKLDIEKTETSKYEFEQFEKGSLQDKLQQEVVKGGGIVTILEQLYRRDLEKLMNTYQALCDVDPEILRQLDVNIEAVRKGLREKIENLKDRYWSELFSNLDTITNKLTTASRRAMLDKLTAHTHIDFTESNAHALVCWVVKNANFYFSSQLVDIVKTMTEKANVINYKSNERVYKAEQWRYYSKPDDLEKYKLDYRIVLERVGGISTSTWRHESVNGLSQRAAEFIDDLCTIAGNLNFDNTYMERVRSFDWETSKKYCLRYRDNKTGMLEVLFEVRAFKNQNLHIRMAPTFACTLNVEFGRLMGWIKSPKEAMDEMDISATDAIAAFNSNIRLTSNNPVMLEFHRAA